MAQNVSAPERTDPPRAGQGRRLRAQQQFEWLARAGIATRGVIYAIIGVLAIKLAFGAEARRPTSRARSRRSPSSPSARHS